MSETVNFIPVGSSGAHALAVSGSQRLWRYYHDQYCLTIITAGGSDWRYRGRDAEADPCTLMLMEPGEVHVTTRVHAAGDFFAMFIPHDYMDDLSREHGLSALHFKGPSLSAPDSIAHLRQLVISCRDNDRQAQEEHLALAIGSVLQHASESSPVDLARDRARARQAAVLLEEKYRADPSQVVDIRDIAKQLRMNYHWLVHSFKDEFGIPPYRFVQSLRRSYARALIAEGPRNRIHSMRDVARICGYADAPHMSRDFKAGFGTSPSNMGRALHAGWTRSLRSTSDRLHQDGQRR